MSHDKDERLMREAIGAARAARLRSSPNPWVGAAVVGTDGSVWTGATAPPGGPHAEIAALAEAGPAAAGSTLYVTLEPCAHTGRTGPCVEAIVDAGVRRVVVALQDPDTRVQGRGIHQLRAAGVEVDVGTGADAVH